MGAIAVQPCAHRTVVDMAIACADLALARDARWTAERHLRLARTHRDALRHPASADAALDALQARVDAHPRLAPMPVPPDLQGLIEAARR